METNGLFPAAGSDDEIASQQTLILALLLGTTDESEVQEGGTSSKQSFFAKGFDRRAFRRLSIVADGPRMSL